METVGCPFPASFSGTMGEILLLHRNNTDVINSTARAVTNKRDHLTWSVLIAGEDSTVGNLVGSVSRFSRCKSVRTSEACWYRRLRSFSKHLLIISSILVGRSGFRRLAETGTRLRMDSKITADVSPRKGNWPVAIS